MAYRKAYRSESTRCPVWDDAGPGVYFVTVCTQQHRCYFGEVKNGKVVLNPLGEIVKEEIHKTSVLRKNVLIDAWVVMPNHVHLIIIITKDEGVATHRRGVATETMRNWQPGCLGAIVNHLKGACTRRIRSEYQHSFAWQPRCHDHIIRGERDLENLRWYTTLNPENWRDGAESVYGEVPAYA